MYKHVTLISVLALIYSCEGASDRHFAHLRPSQKAMCDSYVAHRMPNSETIWTDAWHDSESRYLWLESRLLMGLLIGALLIEFAMRHAALVSDAGSANDDSGVVELFATKPESPAEQALKATAVRAAVGDPAPVTSSTNVVPIGAAHYARLWASFKHVSAVLGFLAFFLWILDQANTWGHVSQQLGVDSWILITVLQNTWMHVFVATFAMHIAMAYAIRRGLQWTRQIRLAGVTTAKPDRY